MRLWHKYLLPVLPDKQLLSQWRECCAIAKNIKLKGTPNHRLVNKVMDYSYLHFLKYGYLVIQECITRGFKINSRTIHEFENNILSETSKYSQDLNPVTTENLYLGWHNFIYLKQCIYNLQEKYDCGMIPENQWKKLFEKYESLFLHF